MAPGVRGFLDLEVPEGPDEEQGLLERAEQGEQRYQQGDEKAED